MTDESLIKAEKDYTEILDRELPIIDDLYTKDFSSALDQLLVLEKQTRQASDLFSSKRVLTKIIDISIKSGNWKVMNEQVQLLSKKHGQLKQAITAMIQEVIKGIDEAPDLDTKVKTIENIRNVTEGKIYVEVERARVSRTLSKIKEEEGDIDAATEILGELQVETYGSMDIREKTEFILEQVELYIKKGDYTRALILSRKIVPRYFEKEETHDLKLRYYELLIQIDLHNSHYLEACQHYRAVYNTPRVTEDEAKWKETLEHIVYFIILSPYDNEQSDLIHRIATDTRLSKLTIHQDLIKCFTANELMRWPKVEQIYGPPLQKTDIFDIKTEEGRTRWNDLRKRVVEHNLRVISKYYTRIRTHQLNYLLDLSEKETEEFISKLVTQGTIYARINRPERIVNFDEPKGDTEVLNEWSYSIGQLLGHVETIGHLIAKEEMIHGMK